MIINTIRKTGLLQLQESIFRENEYFQQPVLSIYKPEIRIQHC